MPSAIDEIMERQKQFKAIRDAKSGSGRFWTKDGDITTFHLLGDDERYITIYVAHEVKIEGQYPKRIYCPASSYHDENAIAHPCIYCPNEEDYPLKQRILAWLYIHENLRLEDKATDADKKLPVVERSGKKYYQRKIDRPLQWEVSGWHTFSPIPDITILREQMGGDLTTRMIEMRQIGSGLELQRRFNIVMDSGPLTQEQLEKTADIQPVQDVLLQQLVESSASGTTVTKPSPQQEAFQKAVDDAATRHAETKGETLFRTTLPTTSDPEGFDPADSSDELDWDPEDPFGS